MNKPQTGIPLVREVYGYTAKFIKENPRLFLPFLIFALFEFVALFVIYYAPRPPLRQLLGPVIRTLWDEKFLHYPMNFLLLPKLVSLSKMALAVFLGSLLTAAAVLMVGAVHNRKSLRLSDSFQKSIKKYISLFIVVLLMVFAIYGLAKLFRLGLLKYFLSGHAKLLFINASLWMGPVLAAINFFLAIFIQAIFVYAIPYIMLGDDKIISALVKSVKLFRKFLFPTLLLVCLPMLVYVPVIILTYKSSFLINNIFPEAVLLVSLIGIIINSLIVDPVITVSTAVLYLLHKEK